MEDKSWQRNIRTKGLRATKNRRSHCSVAKEATPELLAHTLTVIRHRVQEGGQFIVAVEPSLTQTQMNVRVVKTSDGEGWWTAFTGFEEELKGADSVKSTFLTDMGKLFQAALTVPDIQGVILNPWNRTLMLDKHLIEILLPKKSDIFINRHVYIIIQGKSQKRKRRIFIMYVEEYGTENNEIIVMLHGANFVHSFGRQYVLAENII